MSASTVIVAINARLLRLKAEPKPETKAEPQPETKAEPQPETKIKTPSDLTPGLVKRVHELYEELGRKDVKAVEDWEKAEKDIRKDETKAVPQPEAKREAKAEPQPEDKK